jgi:hypothetical protein
MRVGDFSVEVVAVEGVTRELDSGHVLARPGQVYMLRLRNHGPLRAVADISIDGNSVSGRGLVLNAWSVVDLERPIHASERGRFTVIAEGNEQVFGPDGGRDNPDLGVIEARFRRELPNQERRYRELPDVPRPIVTLPSPPAPRPEPHEPWRPGQPRFAPPTWQGFSAELRESLGGLDTDGTIRALFAASRPTPGTEPAAPAQLPSEPPAFGDSIERAAGTGLTGTSDQEFTPVHVGGLEYEATVIRMRLVIGSEEALAAARALPTQEDAPARPAARP